MIPKVTPLESAQIGFISFGMQSVERVAREAEIAILQRLRSDGDVRRVKI